MATGGNIEFPHGKIVSEIIEPTLDNLTATLNTPGQDGKVDYNTLGKMVTAHILGEVGS